MRCRWRWLYRQVLKYSKYFYHSPTHNKCFHYLTTFFCYYSHDLVSALQELGLEGAINVADLMQQMGADNLTGKVSFEQFLQCRLSHKNEIEALGCEEPSRPQVSETWSKFALNYFLILHQSLQVMQRFVQCRQQPPAHKQ